MKLAACSKLALRPVTGTWYRAFDPKYSGTPLGTSHTLNVPSRFSPGPLSVVQFEIMYLAQNHLVCLREVEALLGSPKRAPIANPGQAWLTINVRVQLQQVADLTSLSEQRRLGTTVQELTGDWEGYQTRTPLSPVQEPTGTAPTQDLGEALYSIPGLEAFFAVSAKVPDQMNFIVFPTKLLKGSQLAYHDAATGTDHIVKG